MATIDSVKIFFSNGASAVLDYDGDVQFISSGCHWDHAMIEEVENNATAIIAFNAAMDDAEGK